MRVAFGLKAHSGWAALVAIGEHDGGYIVVDRRRMELVEEPWAKQPYHAAERLESQAARDLVLRGIQSARRIARAALRAAVERERDRKNQIAACAVLVANAMPEWTVAEILAVHFRMHKAEGVLFRDALIFAANACGLNLVTIPEKGLTAGRHGVSLKIEENWRALGKQAGPPWGKDQKEASLAAILVLQ